MSKRKEEKWREGGRREGGGREGRRERKKREGEEEGEKGERGNRNEVGYARRVIISHSDSVPANHNDSLCPQ